MDFQTTKIELIKHLLNVKQQSVLDRLSEILLSEKNNVESKDEIVTYSTNGKTFTKEQYIKHINSISKSVKNGANTNTTKEVKNFILNS